MPPILVSLREDHRNLRRLLAILDAEIAVFERAETPDYDVVTEILDYTREHMDRFHHPAEDLVYARLQKRHPEASGTTHDLLDDHVRLEQQTQHFSDVMHAIAAGTEMSRVRVLEGDKAYLAAQSRHLEVEETWVFPDAERYLTEADWAEIEQEAESSLDPLFGDREGAGFSKLRALLG